MSGCHIQEDSGIVGCRMRLDELNCHCIINIPERVGFCFKCRTCKLIGTLHSLTHRLYLLLYGAYKSLVLVHLILSP